MTSLAQKLSITAGQIVGLLEASVDTAALLRRALPAAVIAEAVMAEVAVGEDRNEAIYFWPKMPERVVERFALLACRMEPCGSIWAVLPTKHVALVRGVALNWEQMQAEALQTDLVDNKHASIAEGEHGRWFVICRKRCSAYTGDEGERR